MSKKQNNKKRIVMEATPRNMEDLDKIVDSLSMSRVGSIRFAISLLSKLTDALSDGQKIVLKDKDNNEHEIWLPQVQTEKEDK